MSLASFRDKKKREWYLSITIRTARLVRSQFGIDLFDMDPKCGGFITLVQDWQKFGDVIALMLDRQIKAQGLTQEEIAKAFKSPGVLLEAVEAMKGAYANFCLPTQGTKLRRMIEAVSAATEAMREETNRETGGQQSTKRKQSTDSAATISQREKRSKPRSE